MREAATQAYAAGLNIVPVKADGSKRPDLKAWRQFRETRATSVQLARMFPETDGPLGLGILAYDRFLNWDFDCAETHAAFVEAAHATGLGPLVDRIADGYFDRTPSGGTRWIVRTTQPLRRGKRKPKLARRPTRLEERRDEHDKIRTLIELPDHAIVAPSHGGVHPSGKPYVRMSGGFDSIATLSVAEELSLERLARTFDQMPAPERPRPPHPAPTNGTRPGDDYNRLTTWPQVLEPHNFRAIYTRGDVTHWRRPGKADGTSATTNVGGSDLLYMFSSSTVFEADRSYDKFGAYSVLNHGGDLAAAAQTLAAQGFGEQRRGTEAGPDARELEAEPSGSAGTDRPPPRLSQASRLVESAIAAGVELWHTPEGEEYATLPIDGHREHHRLTSRAVRDWLARRHRAETGHVPGAQAIADASSALSGTARYDGAEHAVAVRIAGHDGRAYLDPGHRNWAALEIDATGWRLITDPPVRFRRARGMRPLPGPVAGGALETLRDLLPPIPDDDWTLLVAWLVGTLHPRGPYPVLSLSGEQGSAKSTTARMLRRLVDPASAELRAEPREIRDLMIAASNGWIVALDNLSELAPWLSDGVCRLATGGALTTRQLYTDGDEYIFEAVRPVLLTAIGDLVTRGDLQDRALAVTLPTIPPARRCDEARLWAQYDAAAPQLIGALLDAVAGALARADEVTLAAPPRMADWARWTTAAEPALGWAHGTVLAAYDRSRQSAIENVLDADPVAVALQRLKLPWTGTATALLEVLTRGHRRLPRGWPRTPRALSTALRRLAPQLRAVGMELIFDRAPHTRRRLITVEELGDSPSPASPWFRTPEALVESADVDAAGASRASPDASPENVDKSGVRTAGNAGDALSPPLSTVQRERSSAGADGNEEAF